MSNEAGGGAPFIRLWNDEGNVDLRVPITQVGGTVRVAVGEPGRRSEVWRIWANRTRGDLYIASRSIAGVQKYSLHESGDWRYAFTQQFFASMEDETADHPAATRVLDQWERSPRVDGQVVLSIRVRAEDVTPMDDASLKGQIFWIPAPEPGHAVFIGLVMMRSDLELELKGAKPIDLLLLSNNEGVLVLWKSFPLAESARTDLARYREQAEALVPAEIRTRKGESGLRLGIFGFDNDSGERFVWDMAY